MTKDNLKLAYIGGGSRLWARVLMSDLALTPEICGTINLYDIDYLSSKDNEIIGNNISNRENIEGKWKYVACNDIDTALNGVDFVIISIMPGTFEEMQSDVHYPENYGIYQTVGDTTGPGGYLRAMRCVPMYRFFASKIKEICPNAWVINYTNPMTLCVRMLYEEFPKIKAFGCCHEVFGTQNLLVKALKEVHNIEVEKRSDINVEVSGINHFTWITKASYKGLDLFPVFKEYGKRIKDKIKTNNIDKYWLKNTFASADLIKYELFDRYNVIAAAGDRHLAEFMPSKWFLESPEKIIDKWCFNRTSVQYRKDDFEKKLKDTKDYAKGIRQIEINRSDEEGVNQIMALCGIERLITNINIPNVGQVKNYPIGAVLETNGVFSHDSIAPIVATKLPAEINSLILRHVCNQEAFIKAAFKHDSEGVLSVLYNDPLCSCLNNDDIRKMFNGMVKNTIKYLKDYWF